MAGFFDKYSRRYTSERPKPTIEFFNVKTSSVAIESTVRSIAAAKEKKMRVSARPKKSEINKFLKAGEGDPTNKLLLVAAGLWEQFWLVLHQAEGTHAIQYGERVNKSLTHIGIQTWAAKNSDMLTEARRYRIERTSARARELLDAIIIQDLTVEECTVRRFGDAKKLNLVVTRADIRSYLMAFAGLVRLPGAN